MGIERDSTVIYTIGHSTRSIEDFIDILKKNGIRLIVDVRSVPRSRYNPQYNVETLPEKLSASGISYVHMKELGGLRRPMLITPNAGWRNSSLRGYADYMQGAEFEESINRLVELAKKETVAVMCAESVPVRCHRMLISDALVVRGLKVIHIMGEKTREPHTLTPYAKVEGIKITYPPSA